MNTETEMEPPNRGGSAIATADGDGDYIRELGDRIAELSIKEAVEVTRYVRTKKHLTQRSLNSE